MIKSALLIVLLYTTSAHAQCANQYCDSSGQCYQVARPCTDDDRISRYRYNVQRGYPADDERGSMRERQRRQRYMYRTPSRNDMDGPDDY